MIHLFLFQLVALAPLKAESGEFGLTLARQDYWALPESNPITDAGQVWALKNIARKTPGRVGLHEARRAIVVASGRSRLAFKKLALVPDNKWARSRNLGRRPMVRQARLKRRLAKRELVR